MSEWKEIMDAAKEETRKELTEEIRDSSILSENEIELVAPTDLDKSYLRDLLNVMKDNTITNEQRLDYMTSFSGSYLVVNLLEKFIC
jgi:hypothetical protein